LAGSCHGSVSIIRNPSQEVSFHTRTSFFSAPKSCQNTAIYRSPRSVLAALSIGSTDAIGRQATKIKRHSVRVPSTTALGTFALLAASILILASNDGIAKHD
jgi:hypothetical protein